MLALVPEAPAMGLVVASARLTAITADSLTVWSVSSTV